MKSCAMLTAFRVPEIVTRRIASGLSLAAGRGRRAIWMLTFISRCIQCNVSPPRPEQTYRKQIINYIARMRRAGKIGWWESYLKRGCNAGAILMQSACKTNANISLRCNARYQAHG